MNSNSNSSVSLNEFLQDLTPFLNNSDNTEIIINKPGEVITESQAGWQYHQVNELTYNQALYLARLIANNSSQKIEPNAPILSATLPSGERVQAIMPPACLPNTVSITIRKHSEHQYSLSDLANQGFFTQCEIEKKGLSDTDKKLLELKKNRDFEAFLKLAVKSRKNIIISGSTGSGKTTFLKALLGLIPEDERLISIENVDELRLYKTHPNSVSLFYSANNQGVANITQQELLESSLRMRPDRIFLAELIRGDEAFYYIRNVNSGHPGSITTLHANSAELAFEQLVLFMKESKAGTSLSREDIKQILHSCVDVIVQLKNIKGKRVMTELYYEPNAK